MVSGPRGSGAAWITHVPCQTNRAWAGPSLPSVPSSISDRGKKMGTSKTNSESSATITQGPGCPLIRPQARCPVALALTHRLWIHSLEGPGRRTELESPSLGPLPWCLYTWFRFLVCFPRTSRYKRFCLVKSYLLGTTGRHPCLRAWGLQGDGSALLPPPGLDTSLGTQRKAWAYPAWAGSRSKLPRTLGKSV